MTKIIAYVHSSGPIALFFPAADDRRSVVVTPASFERVLVEETETTSAFYQMDVVPAVLRAETDEEFMSRLGLRCTPSGVEFKIADATTVPPADADLPQWFAELGEAHGVGIGPVQWDANEVAAAATRHAEVEAAATEFAAGTTDENEILAADFETRRLAALAAQATVEAEAAAAANAPFDIVEDTAVEDAEEPKTQD